MWQWAGLRYPGNQRGCRSCFHCHLSEKRRESHSPDGLSSHQTHCLYNHNTQSDKLHYWKNMRKITFYLGPEVLSREMCYKYLSPSPHSTAVHVELHTGRGYLFMRRGRGDVEGRGGFTHAQSHTRQSTKIRIPALKQSGIY